MLLRIRWFVMGVLASLGIVTHRAVPVPKAPERLRVRNTVNMGRHSIARLFDSPTGERQPPARRR